MSQAQDITGKSFGFYTVIKKVDSPRVYDTRAYWEVRCSCGRIRTVQGYTLRKGTGRSCGCQGRKKFEVKE